MIIYCRPKYLQQLQQSEMKQLGGGSEYMDRPEISKHNRVRLIQQNKKLMIEIQKLDVIISSIIEKSASNEFQHLEETHQLKQKYSNEQNLQMKEIARLKQAIKSSKASLAEHKYVEIKNQENQIVYLKRQYDKLAEEKYTLTHNKAQKEEALQYHQPLNQQTADTYEKYKKTKIQNGELKSQIHELEREVNKFHKYKELSKTAIPRAHDNPDYQLLKIDTQIKNMKKQMIRIQQKWKPKIQSLDREYFGLKNIFTDKEVILQMSEKELKYLENKATSFRDQQAVANDRQRISAVPISPSKRKQMQDLIQLLTPKPKEQTRKIHDLKTLKENTKTNKDKTQVVSAKGLPVIDERKEEKNTEENVLRQSVDQARASSEKLSEAPPRPSKIMESIGVGTSFYYSDD